MSNPTVTSISQIVTKSSNNSVKKAFLKKHCIVCNSLFTKPRVGKMYCSNRCKQFGYNHKSLQNAINSSFDVPKKAKRIKINIGEYLFYREIVEKVKRFKELSKRNYRFEDENIKMQMRENMGIKLNPESIILINSNQLKDVEIDELDMLREEVSIYVNYEVHNLSLEKWSFFKIMNPKIDFENLFKIICQFSCEFINQLNFEVQDQDKTVDFLSIKTKYIRHCNEINEGVIQFYNKINEI